MKTKEDWKEKRERMRQQLQELGVPVGNGVELFYDPKDNSFAVAAIVDSLRESSTSFLSNVGDLEDVTTAPTTLAAKKREVKLAMSLYLNEGVVGTVIGRLVDYTPKGRIVCDNPELKSILKLWANKVNGFSSIKKYRRFGKPPIFPGLTSLLIEGSLLWHVTGDWIVGEIWKEVPIKIGKKKKNLFLPVELVSMDVTTIDIPVQSAEVGIELMYWQPPSALKSLAKKYFSKRKLTPIEQDIVNLFDKKILRMIAETSKILLPPENITHFKRGVPRYYPYGISFARKLFSAVAYKRRIRALDIDTIDGLIQRLTILKVGKIPADGEADLALIAQRVSLMRNMIENRENRRTNRLLVWGGDDVEVVDIGPDGKILGFADRYNQANRDLLQALGFPPLLIDGESTGSAARDWAVLVSIVAHLQNFESMRELWLTNIMKQIAELNGYDSEGVGYKANKIVISVDRVMRIVAQALFDRGGLSWESFLEEQGYDFDLELKKRMEEQKNKVDKILAPRAPTFVNLASVGKLEESEIIEGGANNDG